MSQSSRAIGGPDVPRTATSWSWVVGAAGAAAQPAQSVPDGVAVQQLLLAGVAASGDDRVVQRSSLAQLLIACGQRPDGDQDAAQVLDRLAARAARREAAWVSSFPAQLPQDRRRRRSCPARPRRWPGRSAVAAPGRGPEGPGGCPRPRRRAAHAAAAWWRTGRTGRRGSGRSAPQAGQAAPEAGVGAGAGRAERLGPGAAADSVGSVRIREHRAQRCLQASHHGWPVALDEVTQGASRPQIEQVIDLSRAAGRAERPVRGADADRPPAVRSWRRSPGWPGR